MISYFRSRLGSNAFLLIGGVVIIAILLVPYASNGFWYDDSLNSQIYFYLQRVHVDLGEHSYAVVMHWLKNEGRLIFSFFYGYLGFYFVHDLRTLRLVQCFTVLINVAFYGYILALLGASLRYIVLWAVILVSLFQISIGLDAVAGFAFHYQVLGIQLSIVLIFFVKWLENNNPTYLYSALILWLIFMLSYETNSIFIPIAFVLMLFKKGGDKKIPILLLVLTALVYLALNLYFRVHANGASYMGTAFGDSSKIGIAYLKQLTATFPLISYLAITHKSLPFLSLIKETLTSMLTWSVFIFSCIFFMKCASEKLLITFPKPEAFIISGGMFLLPAIFPAISLRYQNEVGWGAGTLPTYYQCFGLAFFIAWQISSFWRRSKYHFFLPIAMSVYLALNLSINLLMVEIIDKGMREPRESFANQAKLGLFSHVKDGDIIRVVNVAGFINENLIYQWTGKRVFMTKGDHMWHRESPGKFAKTFVLSRSSTAEHKYMLIEIPVVANYKFIPSHELQTSVLDNFPKTLPMIEMQLVFQEAVSVSSVNIIAPNGLGDWTTRPVKNTWGIGILNKVNSVADIINKGPRVAKLNFSVDRDLLLWFPDNGNLYNCPELQIEISLENGKSINTVADCKLKK